MNLLLGFVTQLLHAALMVATAPTLLGVIRCVQARLVGRAGPTVLQPWRDLARLLRKQPVIAESASEVFAIAPLLSAAAVAIVAFLVPSFALGMTLARFGDLLVIAGLLALARCSMALAGMDTGSAIGGMGASRTVALTWLSEPAVLLVIFALGLLAGGTNLDVIAAMQQESSTDWPASVGLAFVAMVLLAIVDANGPAMSPELAMQREAMALEFSGRDLALIEATEALRLLVWLDLIGAVFLPFGMAPAGAGPADLLVGLLSWLVRLLLLGGVLALLQTAMGRMRPAHLPHVLGLALLLGLLAVMFLFASTGVA
jgi:formate hydrogenlyase subunit 4